MTSFPPEDGDGQVSTALVPFVVSTALVPFVASTALVPFAFTTTLVPFVPRDGQFCRAAVGETAEGCGEAMAAAHSNPLPNEVCFSSLVSPDMWSFLFFGNIWVLRDSEFPAKKRGENISFVIWLAGAHKTGVTIISIYLQNLGVNFATFVR